MTSKTTADERLAITKSDLTRMSLNIGSMGLEISWTYANQMGLAFGVMMDHILKKIYHSDPEGYAKALERHTAFFNITVQLAPFVGGIVASMEEKIAKGEIPPSSVNEVKAALMGPLSGIGDSIFLMTLRVLAAGVGVSMAQMGNPFAPLVFLLIYNVPGFVLRVWGAQKGYEMGVGLLESAQRNGIMDRVMAIAGIVGIMVLGSMTVDMFWAGFAVEFGAGDEVQSLQAILDSIMPGMLALGCFWFYYWLLGKKVSPTALILGTMLVGVIGVYFGILM
ncbi:PTS system mannose/fructose/sorbose family transporter subunit IID [Enorma sp.]|uniref:PTS system mannose/fructose/sorbose family transporter subunit IID n=1 Tax=Enorma sp. TaxID=1920692 RepID=UPI003AB7A9E0